MTIRLVVRQRGEAEGQDQPNELLLDDALITLGRDQSCQVVLPMKAVSRNHARITRDGGLFFVEDLGSSYGTQVNGKTLPKGEKRLLRNGDVIVIAQFDVTFDRVQDPKPAGGQSERTAFVARQAVKDVMRGLAGNGGDAPYLRIMNGPREGEHLELPEAKELVLGRDETADVTLKGDDLVSRRHAKVRRDWSGTHVEDLGSRNGIRVNKKRFDRRTLKDKDELEVGGTRMLFVDPSSIEEASMSLAAVEPSGEQVKDTNHNLAAQDSEPPGAEEPKVNPIPSDPPKPASEPPAEGAESQPSEAAESEAGESEVGDSPLEGSEASEMDLSSAGEEGAPPEDEGGERKSFLQDPAQQKKYIMLGAIGLLVVAAVGILIAVLAGG